MKFVFHPEALFELEAAADFTLNAKRAWKFVLSMQFTQQSTVPVMRRRGGDYSMEIFDDYFFMYSRMLFFTRSKTDFFTSLQ